ncbi:MAG: hypothetical protein IJ747_02210 [Lachnospiraceae bacterium]|nr:hypothetical protein [Lachnospiraceae bacterium]
MDIANGLRVGLPYTIVTLVMLFGYFPINWTKREFFCGIKNRKEYLAGSVKERIDAIISAGRRKAGIIEIVGCVMQFLLFALPYTTMSWIVGAVLLFAHGILFSLFMARENREIKRLKRELGIAPAQSLDYVPSDMESVKKMSIRRMIVSVVPVLLLYLIAILIGNALGGGTRILSGTVILMFTVVPICIAVYLVAEYADIDWLQKSGVSDMALVAAFVTVLFQFVFFAMFYVLPNYRYPERLLFLGGAAGTLILFVLLVVFASGVIRAETSALRASSVTEDEDDNWICGMFYYNPHDTRLLVRDRTTAWFNTRIDKELGARKSVNYAHPVGKASYLLALLMLSGFFVFLVCMGITLKTPMTVKVESGAIICRQLVDEYRIPIEEVQQTELLGPFGAMDYREIQGVTMDSIRKGDFQVESDGICKVFLYTNVGSCIRLRAADGIYYISGATTEETSALFAAINEGNR